MFRLYVSFTFFTGTMTLAAMSGCGSQAATPPQMTQAAQAPQAPEDAAPTPPKADGLKDLSPEDRAAAEQQRVCPVSGELLGAMGKPIKITIGNRAAFLCCSGCEEEFRKHPEKYFAKMKKK
jgi:hypothetical protein